MKSQAIDLNAAYVTLVNEGAKLFADEKHEAALALFWKAFRIRPSAPTVLFNIGRVMEELKDPRCEDFFAAAATQGNVDALYHLATLYVREGHREATVETLRAYLKGNPEEDACTQWARATLLAFCPPTGPTLVWRNPKAVKKAAKLRKKLSKNGIHKKVMFGIL